VDTEGRGSEVPVVSRGRAGSDEGSGEKLTEASIHTESVADKRTQPNRVYPLKTVYTDCGRGRMNRTRAQPCPPGAIYAIAACSVLRESVDRLSLRCKRQKR